MATACAVCMLHRPPLSILVLGVCLLKYPAVSAIRAYPVSASDGDRTSTVRAFLVCMLSHVCPGVALLQPEVQDQTGYEQRRDYDHHCVLLLLVVGNGFMQLFRYCAASCLLIPHSLTRAS